MAVVVWELGGGGGRWDFDTGYMPDVVTLDDALDIDRVVTLGVGIECFIPAALRRAGGK